MKVFLKKHSFPNKFNNFTCRSGHFGDELGSFGDRSGLVFHIWGRVGGWVGGALAPYLRLFHVEKHKMASVMGIRAGLVGPKSENVEQLLIFKAFLYGSERT